jgi:hypothetical protein
MHLLRAMVETTNSRTKRSTDFVEATNIGICNMAKTTLLPKFLQLNQCIKPQPQTMTYQLPERKQVQDTIQQVLCNNYTLSRAMIYTIIPCLREVNIQ